MPAIKAGAKVLVTGANGYIASWLVHDLLQQRYLVRAAVRSLEKGKSLQKQFKVNDEQLEIAVVGEMTNDGAFDQAVQGVDAIAHMASPLSTQSDDPDDFIKPAVLGTLGVLNSALQHGSTVKRIIVTSSTAAVMRPTTELKVYAEEDWGNDPATVEEQGKAAPMIVKYRASKTLAEKAAWDFYHSHKTEVGWDLVVLNPPLVYGPPVDSKSPLNGSVNLWYNMAIKDDSKSEDALKQSHSYVDVRDVAEAHVLALNKEAAGGERVIISAGAITWQETIDLVNSFDPAPRLASKPTKGLPGIDKSYLIRYNNEKGIKLLGVKYRTLENTIQDMLANFSDRGL